MKIIEIYNKVIHVKAESQYDITSIFVRMQEFYESPYDEIRGKYFTLETFMDRYAKDHNNEFTYFTDWSGFNIPGNVIKDFYNKFSDLSEKEQTIKKFLEDNNLFNDDKFYIIGTYDDSALDHELAHAFYYLEDEYRTEVTEQYKKLPDNIKTNFNMFLERIGYTTHVFEDETNAYFATSAMVDLSYKLNMKGTEIPWLDIYNFQQLFFDIKFANTKFEIKTGS